MPQEGAIDPSGAEDCVARCGVIVPPWKQEDIASQFPGKREFSLIVETIPTPPAHVSQRRRIRFSAAGPRTRISPHLPLAVFRRDERESLARMRVFSWMRAGENMDWAIGLRTGNAAAFSPGGPLPPVLSEAESGLVGAAGEFPKNSINIDKFTGFFDKLIY